MTVSGWQGEHEQEGQPEDAHLEPPRVLDRGGEDPGAGPDGEPVDEDDADQRQADGSAALALIFASALAPAGSGRISASELIGSPPWRRHLGKLSSRITIV